jgi:hypothetical protein
MSNDKMQAWRTVSDEVMSTYADSPMGTTHAVEMAAEKAYDLGAHHGRKEALESGESWAKFRADMGPGVGPAWRVSEIDPRGNGVRLVLWGTGVSVSYERGLRQLLNQSLPVDVTAYPAAPSRPVVDTARAEGFAAGLTRARDLLAAHADESEALARGQATEAEQAQTRAAASATRAAVQRGGVDLLNREIADLKGEGK